MFILFEKNFAKDFVKKKEIIPEIKMTKSINNKLFPERFPIICWIATAAPVLVFEIT